MFRLACIAAILTTACSASVPAPSKPELPDGISYCGEDLELTRTNVVCVEPLSDQAMRGRRRAFKLTHADGKVVRVETITSFKTEEWTRWELVYDGDEVREERQWSGFGSLLFHGVFDRGGKREVFRDARGEPLLYWRYDEDAAYNVIERTYDAAGFLASKRHMTVGGRPGKDEHGVHVYRYRKNERGQTLETTAFDSHDKPIGMGDGAHKLVRTYTNNLVGVERRFDVRGKPLSTDSAGAVQTSTRDANGNVTVVRHADAAGSPMRERTIRYDSGGREVSSTITAYTNGVRQREPFEVVDYSYLANGLPARIVERSENGVSTSDATWDDAGRLVGIRWYDTNDKLAGGMVTRHDDDRHLARRIFFDATEQVTRFDELSSDEQGRLLKRRYFATDGSIDTEGHCATIRYLYDEDGFNPRVICFDPTGKEIDVVVFDLLVVDVDETRDHSTAWAKARANEALAHLRLGDRFVDVVATFDTRRHPGLSVEERLFARDLKPSSPLWAAVLALEVGANTGVIEDGKGFVIGWRER